MKKKNILLNITSFQADKELKLKFVMANKGHILTKEVDKKNIRNQSQTNSSLIFYLLPW